MAGSDAYGKSVRQDPAVVGAKENLKETVARVRKRVKASDVMQGSFLNDFFNEDNTVKETSETPVIQTQKQVEFSTAAAAIAPATAGAAPLAKELTPDERAREMHLTVKELVWAQASVESFEKLENDYTHKWEREDDTVFEEAKEKRTQAMARIKDLFGIEFMMEEIRDDKGAKMKFLTVCSENEDKMIGTVLNFLRQKYSQNQQNLVRQKIKKNHSGNRIA